MIDYELEQLVLGSMCQGSDCLTLGMARLNKGHFDKPIHKAVFELMKTMYEANKKIDVLTVAQEGKELLSGSGVSWLMIKEAFVPSGTFSALADKLNKLYEYRCLSNMAVKVIDRVREGMEPQDITAEIESSIFTVGGQESEIMTPNEHARRMMDTIEKRMNQKSNGGIYTTYTDLNMALNGGFEPGQLIILAAQTGKGKTAFAMNLTRDIAVKSKIPSLYINTEMSGEQMDCRWMSILTGIFHSKIASGKLDDKEVSQVMKAFDVMNNSGFYSVTEPALTMQKLVSICRRYAAQKKCRVIVVDYIGRMDTLDAKLQEWQVLKTAAKRLKTLAQELGATVIMLAQVNDDEKLEGARAMKNECDLYGYLRPLYADELATLAEFNYCLSIEKNRSGPTRKIPLKFYGEILTFKGA
jgi:replicative DNA helicase